MLVVKLDPLSAAAGVLKENDVVMEVAGQAVADDGTSVFRDDERLEYSHIVRCGMLFSICLCLCRRKQSLLG